MNPSMLKYDNLMVIFGGYTNNQYFSDVWRFNTCALLPPYLSITLTVSN